MAENWNENGFPAFYAEHYAAVREYAARLFGANDADDVAQETMLRTLRRPNGLDLTGSPRPWLFVVARNVAVDLHRRRDAVPMDADALAALAPPVPDEVAAVSQRLDLATGLRQAMRGLCHRDREVLVLHEIEGLAIPEIAHRAGITPNAVRQRLFRARTNLGRQFKSLGGGRYAIVPAATPLGRAAIASVTRWVVAKVESVVPHLRLGAGNGAAVAAVVTAVVSAPGPIGVTHVDGAWIRPPVRRQVLQEGVQTVREESQAQCWVTAGLFCDGGDVTEVLPADAIDHSQVDSPRTRPPQIVSGWPS